MVITGINHAQITIPTGSEDRARAFYCTLLGLSEIPKPDSLAGRGGFWLQVGALQVHIGTEDNVERKATKAHLAYEVDDIETWHRILLQNSVVILDSVPIPGFARFEFRDPFDNRVEFIQPLK